MNMAALVARVVVVAALAALSGADLDPARQAAAVAWREHAESMMLAADAEKQVRRSPTPMHVCVHHRSVNVVACCRHSVHPVHSPHSTF